MMGTLKGMLLFFVLSIHHQSCGPGGGDTVRV